MTKKNQVRKNKRVINGESPKPPFMNGAKNLFIALFFYGGVATMAVSFILFYDILIQCDYFDAKKIEVTGNHILKTDEVLKTAGVTRNMNILGLNLSLARKRLLHHPWIKDADIQRIIPDGIIINIQEHQPLAIVDIGQNFLINTDGKLIKKVTSQDQVRTLPVVSGLELSDIKAFHEGYSNHYAAVLKVLRLGEKMTGELSNSHVKNIQIDRDLGVTLHIDSNIKAVKLGFNDYEKKYERLEKILLANKKIKGTDDIANIDLNNPNRVIITPVGRT